MDFELIGDSTVLLKMKCLLVLLGLVVCTTGIYNQDRIRLEDLKVLTLYSDRVTTGRRSSPVPQLKCVGGSAQNAYRPLTVQCYNRGNDGYSTQWECKTDMDNDFRFGKVEVTCEGYDYPEDPYILRGSCGLEYTLEYTKEGYNRQQSGYQGNKHHGYHQDKKNYQNYYPSDHHSNFGTLVMLGIVGVVIYVIYKTCLANNQTPDGDAPPPYSEHDHFRQRPGAPPPPGFKPDFTSGTYSQGANAPPPPGFKPDFIPGTQTAGDQGAWSSSSTGASAGMGTAPAAGGFWTGAATGGILGYLFGRNNSGYRTGYDHRTYHETPSSGRSWFSGSSGSTWGNSGSSGFGGGSSGFGGGSSGTRTASGFGGTKRR